jgi:hypothetical protein
MNGFEIVRPLTINDNNFSSIICFLEFSFFEDTEAMAESALFYQKY